MLSSSSPADRAVYWVQASHWLSGHPSISKQIFLFKCCLFFLPDWYLDLTVLVRSIPQGGYFNSNKLAQVRQKPQWVCLHELFPATQDPGRCLGMWSLGHLPEQRSIIWKPSANTPDPLPWSRTGLGFIGSLHQKTSRPNCRKTTTV